MLKVENLSVTLDERDILKDLSFAVNEGEVAAIIGPNGAGKSVLLRALIGLLPHEGAVHWRRDAKIGYVPQKLAIERSLPLTIREFFLLHEKRFLLSGIKTDERIIEALASVQLPAPVLHQRLGILSGGELQRVLIAWALFDQPNVLLFDEPTAGVDVGGEETIYNVLHELQDKTGITIVLVSHELNVVFRYATSVFCLNKKLLCSGTPEETLTPEQLRALYGDATYYHHLHEYHDSDKRHGTSDKE